MQARRNASKRWYRYVPGEIRLGFVGQYVHDFNFSIFAGISRQGATELVLYEGRCNAVGFRRIFAQSVLPFAATVYATRRWRLQMDNARYHVSPLSRAFFVQHQINHFATPAQSPDFNPIELVWHDLKVFIRENVKPSTQAELIDGITEFWENIVTVEYCNKKIDHLEKVLKVCVELQGLATGL